MSQPVTIARRLAASSSRAERAFEDWLRPSVAGVVVAALFFGMSLTPSLLPRPWLAQSLISGVTCAVGYGIGTVVGWSAGRVRAWFGGPIGTPRWRSGPLSRLPRRIWTAVAVALVVAALYQGSQWQRDLYRLMGLTPPSRVGYLRVPAIALGVLAGAVAAVRLVRAAGYWLTRRLRQWLPPGPTQTLGVAAGLVLAVGLAEEIALGGFLSVASGISSVVNDRQSAAYPQPLSALRSGSPQSLVSWYSLGREGREFVAGAPTLAQLRRFDGAAAMEPIRVYVGLRSAPDPRAAAALAVRELQRTGGFSRAVLCVVTTTGTGWVDPYLAKALEYVYGGDTAMVGVQYSYLPSWLSFLSERHRVAQAGPELFEQVYASWASLPVGHRPKLLVFGESLGSLGSEATFTGLDDVRARTDGVLWAGPTNANPIWRRLVQDRDAGSPEVLPIYRQGTAVRFVSRPDDLARPDGPWTTPRVVYLQNPSDPVTWWSPRLAWQRPDWLTEPPGRDLLPDMHWFPVVTFVQVTADLALAYGAPPGHGHQFHAAAVAAWAAIAAPPGWTAQRSAELTRLLGP